MSLRDHLFHEEPGITLYCGDCRDVLPLLGPVDLVLTDPPYGIARVWQGGFGRGWGKADTQKLTRNAWDAKPPDAATLNLVRAAGKTVILWGGQYFALPPSRGWLVWNKPERGFTLAEAELAWTSRDAVIRVFDEARSDVDREHPTQKPLILMERCILWAGAADTVLDPFTGSGTTLLAAKNLGRRAIGIEIEPRYCEIAVKRLRQEVLAL